MGERNHAASRNISPTPCGRPAGHNRAQQWRLARLAKAGPDAVMLLVLEKAFGGPIDFRREMAVMLDA